MPDADKCYLEIPFKEHLTSLANTADDDGKVTKADLVQAGQREFENYKAIERRINDPGCAGGACAWGFNGAGSWAEEILTFTGADVEVVWPNGTSAGFLSPSGSTLPAGLWHVTGYAKFTFAAPADGSVQGGYLNPAFENGANPATCGGFVQGENHFVGLETASTSFSGVVLEPSVWSPSIFVFNATDQSCTSVEVVFHAFGTSDHCHLATSESGF